MVNKNFLILFFVLITQLSFCQIETKTLNSLNLIGKVSSVSDLTFLARDSIGNIIKGNILNEYENRKLKIDDIQYNKTGFKFGFDKNGNQILKGEYNEYGYLWDITDYKYLNNKIVESNQIYKLSDMTIKVKALFKYDDRKNLVSIIKYRDGELFEKELFKYNDLNKLIEKKLIDDSGNITEKLIKKYLNHTLIYHKVEKSKDNENSIIEESYRFDTLGNKVYSMYHEHSRDEYGKEEDFLSEYKHEYKNNLISKESFLINGKQVSTVTYEYLDGKESNIIIKDPVDNSIISSRVISYYQNSTKIYEKIIKTKEETTIQTFDKNGNILKLQITKINIDPEEYSYEYSFDKIGNWIKTIEYKNTIPLKIRERKIIYY